MKNCSECNGKMNESTSKTPEGMSYLFYNCETCGNQIVDMTQLHNLAQKYRTTDYKLNL